MQALKILKSLKKFWDGIILYENKNTTNELSDNIANDLQKSV